MRLDKETDIVVITSSKLSLAVLQRKLPGLVMAGYGSNGEIYDSAHASYGKTGAKRVIAVLLKDVLDTMKATRSIILEAKPQIVVLLGIAGGISRKTVQLGDVIVANQIFDIENQFGESIDHIRPFATDLRSSDFIRMIQPDSWTKHIKSKRPGPGKPSLHIGPIAISEKVVSNKELDNFVANKYPQLLAVDMEAGGVIKAMRGDYHQPDLLVIEGICEIVTEGKQSPKWQDYAAEAAAALVVELIQNDVFLSAKQEIPVPAIKAKSPRRKTETPQGTDSLSEEAIEADEIPADAAQGGASSQQTAQLGQPQTDNKHTFKLPGYDSDSPQGDDYLNIDRDVNAFASLIAARDTTPPLSIGIFGEWGTGKTFFMRRLMQRVWEISAEAQNSGRMQKEIAYYKRIVQVEFNAWHYSDGNLWASLVDHLLANLQVQQNKEDNIEALQQMLLNKLGVQKVDADKARQKVDEAERHLAVCKTQLEVKESEYKKIAVSAEELKSKDILEAVISSEDMQEEIGHVKAILSEIGFNQFATEANTLWHSVQEAKNTLQRSAALLSPFVNSPKRWKWIGVCGACLVAAPLLGLLVGIIVERTQGQWFMVSSLLTTLTGWMALASTTLLKSAKWVRDRLAPIENLEKTIQARLAEKQNAVKKEILSLEQRLAQAKENEERASAELAKAELQVERTKDELAQATPARLLTRFIQDRVESSDYRKHLGMLALIRHDFERLSNLLEQENTRCHSFANLDEEQKDESCRINRIVLYIDDLDRCPTEKVIQVLQAVHLLLAFPLFVVVVAVDARWISGALRERYGQLLAQDDNIINENDLSRDAATPLDYLEKIFQIPFWLNSMDHKAREQMIQGLIGFRTIDDIDPGPAPTRLGSSYGVDKLLKTGEQSLSSGETGALTPAFSSAFAFKDSTTINTGINLNPDTLIIDPDEYEYIKRMIPLLGRSPRALKRFINVYRIIKTSLSDDERQDFGAAKINKEYRLVLFLLAIVTHRPKTSQSFFWILSKMVQAGGQKINFDSSDWTSLLNVKASGTSDDKWHQLSAWIQSDSGSDIRTANVQRIVWWSRRISRYSFLLEPGV